jgi:hypothetical protein
VKVPRVLRHSLSGFAFTRGVPLRRKAILVLFIAGALCVTVPAAFGQEKAKAPRLKGYFTVRRPAHGVELEALRAKAVSAATAPTATTLPLWTFDVLSSRDGNSYPGVMVGLDPFNKPGSVTVPTKVVPLKIVTHTIGTSVDPKTGAISTKAGLTTFNPAVADTACLTPPNDVPTKLFEQSPILNAATFDFGGTIVGTTEYIDAFQRGNFWNANKSVPPDYHVELKAAFLEPITIDVPAPLGLALATSALGPPNFCAPMAIVDINWFDTFLTGTVIPALAAKGVHPTTFPVFFVHNVVWASPVTNLTTCCALGYHSLTGFPIPTQTYSPADFDSTGLFGPGAEDTAVMSHEVGEWMNDPFTINPTPAWGGTGQVAGCQNNLEVGDPLSGTDAPPIVMSNGFTYHLQELAFFSWFFGAPSVGINGWFSNNGTFLTDAGPVCIPQ